MLPRAALPSKPVQALIVREQLWSFNLCHYSQLPQIQFVNKLVTNSETRDSQKTMEGEGFATLVLKTKLLLHTAMYSLPSSSNYLFVHN